MISRTTNRIEQQVVGELLARDDHPAGARDRPGAGPGRRLRAGVGGRSGAGAAASARRVRGGHADGSVWPARSGRPPGGRCPRATAGRSGPRPAGSRGRASRRDDRVADLGVALAIRDEDVPRGLEVGLAADGRDAVDPADDAFGRARRRRVVEPEREPRSGRRASPKRIARSGSVPCPISRPAAKMPIRSQTSWTWLSRWLERRIAICRGRRRARRRSSRISTTPSGSIAVVGSSRIRTSGSLTSASAMPSRWSMPREYVSVRSSARPGQARPGRGPPRSSRSPRSRGIRLRRAV